MAKKLLRIVVLLIVCLAELNALPALENVNAGPVVAERDAEIAAADPENVDLKSSESFGYGFYPGLYGYGGYGRGYGGFGYGYGSRWGYGGYQGYGGYGHGYGGYYRHPILPVWG